MGLKDKKKPHKEKVKRKRGNKYIVIQKQNKITNKENPFEEISKKKFIKYNTNQYKELINDYRNKNNVNLFKDNRIGEGSKNLSEDDKMKLRYNIQQRLKKSNKKAKFLFEDEKNTKEEDLIFTHKGKKINENDNFEIEENDNEDYYNEMNNYIEKINENPKLTKKEKLKEIINHSKKFKEEKQRKREENTNKIEILDEKFSDLVTLLKKRQRSFNKFNDDYDRMTNNFIYLDQTHPTDTIKTQEELEEEKQYKLKKMEIQKMKEEEDESDDNNTKFYDKGIDEDNNDKHLTKKERIEKLIQERLSKSKEIQDKMNKGNKKIIYDKNNNNNDNEENEEESEEDNLDDLNDEEGEEDEDENENNNEEENEEEVENNNNEEGEEGEEGEEEEEEEKEEEEEEKE